MPLPGGEKVRGLRPPGPGGVVWEISRWCRLPGLENRCNYLPGALYLISPHEKGRITPNHIQKQRLVCLGWYDTEDLACT